MKRLFTLFLGLMLSVIFLLAGIQAPALAQTDEIRIADSKGDWGFPNPWRHYPRGPGYIRMSMVFDTLVWKDQTGFIPALADSWSYNSDKMAFTFTLNPKAKWHDGKPVTSADVAFTLDYFKKHPYAWISTDFVDRVEAPDPLTAVFYLAKPYSPFISDIGGTMPILPKHIWETVDNPANFNDPKAFVGSGPYVFKDFNKAQGTYLFEAFPDYYQGAPLAKKLIYVRSGKPLVSLMTGEVDLAAIEPDMAEPLRKKGLTIIKDERGWNKKLMINHKKPPFSEKQFRQALAYAIDQQEIIDKSHRGLASPASYGLLSMDHDMYNPDTPTYPPSPEKAKSMISALGYQTGPDGKFVKDGQPLKIVLLASSITVGGQNVPDRDGEVIKSQLERIGIQVDLLNMEQATLDSRVKNWDFDLAISGHGGISGDPRMLNESTLTKYGPSSVNNARFDSDPKLAQLMEDQMAEMDPVKRKAIVFEIQKTYAEDVPAISLYYPDSMSAFNPKKGVTWYYTKGGISKGIPIPQNKMSLVEAAGK